MAEDFDVGDHITEFTIDGAADFPRLLNDLASQPLPFDRPLWRIALIDGSGPGSTLVFSIHHAVADGIALLQVLLALCDDEADPAAASGAAAASQADQRRSWTPRPFGAAVRAIGGVRRVVDDPAWLVRAPLDATIGALTLLRLTIMTHTPDTQFTGELGGEKRAAWTRSFAIKDVKAAARRLEVTINDVMTAAVTGALGSYLDQRRDLDPNLILRAMVPVNVRPLEDAPTMGNYFGLVLPDLPVGERDPARRLALVKAEMDRIKASPEPAVTFGILRTIGVVTTGLHRFVVNFFAGKSAAVLTNVPGPRSTLFFAGAPITSMMFWVPQSGGLGLGISILSYAGDIGVGVVTDADLVPDPETITAEIERDVDALLAL